MDFRKVEAILNICGASFCVYTYLNIYQCMWPKPYFKESSIEVLQNLKKDNDISKLIETQTSYKFQIQNRKNLIREEHPQTPQYIPKEEILEYKKLTSSEVLSLQFTGQEDQQQIQQLLASHIKETPTNESDFQKFLNKIDEELILKCFRHVFSEKDHTLHHRRIIEKLYPVMKGEEANQIYKNPRYPVFVFFIDSQKEEMSEDMKKLVQWVKNRVWHSIIIFK